MTDSNTAGDLALRATARERRLKQLSLAFIVSAAVMIGASSMTGWTYEYAGPVGVNAFETSGATAKVQISVRDMASVVENDQSGVANPTAYSVAGIPLFLLFAVAASALAALGAFVGSAGLAVVALLGYGYAWSSLGVSKMMFATSGTDAGWKATAGAGLSLFTTTLFAAAITTMLTGCLAVAFQRAERAARIAAGERVEETTLAWISKKLHAAGRDDDTASTAAR